MIAWIEKLNPNVMEILMWAIGAIIGTAFTLLVGANAYFISRLVKKLDSSEKTANDAKLQVAALAEKVKGIDRIIREISELKADFQLFKYILSQNLGVKLPDAEKK